MCTQTLKPSLKNSEYTDYEVSVNKTYANVIQDNRLKMYIQ